MKTKVVQHVPRINISMTQSQTQTQTQTKTHRFPAFVMLTFFFDILIVTRSTDIIVHRAGSQLKKNKGPFYNARLDPFGDHGQRFGQYCKVGSKGPSKIKKTLNFLNIEHFIKC